LVALVLALRDLEDQSSWRTLILVGGHNRQVVDSADHRHSEGVNCEPIVTVAYRLPVEVGGEHVVGRDGQSGLCVGAIGCE
jgi:hypothetical protein